MSRPSSRNPDVTPTPPSGEGAASRTVWRTAVALAIGLLLSIVLNLVTPYNNWILNNSFIADSFLPIGPMFFMFVIVLAINPLLRWRWPRAALERWQLSLVFGMMLFTCVTLGGVLRIVPYMIAKAPIDVSQNKPLAQVYEQMRLPPSMFPDKIGYGQPVNASVNMINELPRGESIPWSNWLGPLATWGVFAVFCGMMMIALAAIVLPQWRRNERLPFPLLTVENAMIETPKDRKPWASIFRGRAFWVAVMGVFTLHLLSGLSKYYPGQVPAIPLTWDLGSLFTEGPLRYLPGYIYKSRLAFFAVGFAFFMPTRVSFSIWFFTIAYALYEVACRAYFPPYGGEPAEADDRLGAALAMTVSILWLGRAHWKYVFSCLFRKDLTAEQRSLRHSLIMFLAGCAGMYGWLVWVGVQAWWAAFYVIFGFMVSLLITRVIAETGLPSVRISFAYQMSLVGLAPVAWLSAVTVYMGTVMYILFPFSSRVSGSAMASHAFGLDEGAAPSDGAYRRRTWMSWGMVGLIILALLVGGVSTLWGDYHNSTSRDGTQQPVNPWGVGRLQPAHNDVLALEASRNDPASSQQSFSRTGHSQIGHIAFGATLAGLLQWACMSWPRWPLHPLGVLIGNSFDAMVLWPSILVGWLAKIILVRYGGAALFKRGQNVFLGLILGEILSAVFWAIVPAILLAMGKPYLNIGEFP